jgi:glycogen debranching enzyme-like protein
MRRAREKGNKKAHMATTKRHTRVAQRGGSSARTRSVQPVVAKQGNLFLLSTDDGDLLANSDQGLYFHDMRYLSAQTLRLDNAPLVSLVADASDCRLQFSS